jgi:hypothetical protein
MYAEKRGGERVQKKRVQGKVLDKLRRKAQEGI